MITTPMGMITTPVQIAQAAASIATQSHVALALHPACHQLVRCDAPCEQVRSAANSCSLQLLHRSSGQYLTTKCKASLLDRLISILSAQTALLLHMFLHDFIKRASDTLHQHAGTVMRQAISRTVMSLFRPSTIVSMVKFASCIAKR